jgi:Family of unknown function (DUF5824)
MYNITKKARANSNKMITKRYLPDRLSRKDRVSQARMLKKSRRLYKKGIYFSRKQLKSYPHKNSSHVIKAKKIYNVETIKPSKELANKTGCSVEALEKILNKGEGAYFSSGSRPNQTAQSWGIARLASSITGGKAAAVDYNILEEGCQAKSRALQFAKQSRQKYAYGKRRVPKTKL